MKNKRGLKNGCFWVLIWDTGDRCLFIFLLNRPLFFNVFPFPLSTDKLLGDFRVNRRCAPNCSVRFPCFEVGGRWRCRGDRCGDCEGDGDGEEIRGDGDCWIPIQHFFSQSRRLLTKMFESVETVNEKFRCL